MGLLYIIENCVTINNIGLNFVKFDSIIGQSEVYDLSLLLLCKDGTPPSLAFSMFNPVGQLKYM